MEPIYRLPPDLMMFPAAIPLSEIIDWGQEFAHLPEAWKQSAGEGVKVAVLDTGVDVRHVDLQGQILDVADFTNSIYGPEDRHSHGTHCSGVIAANANEIGIRGGAYKAKLLCGKVLGDNGSGNDRSIEGGVLWAASKGADIISMSLGGPQMSDRLHRVFMELAAAGTIIFAAAGNDGGAVNFPGAWAETIGVGAIGRDGKLTDFTSRGPELDILGPGVDILSTVPGNRYATMSGTSMATPFCAAVGALALSKHRKDGGKTDLENVTQMREHLKRTARKSDGSGYGLIDPVELLKEEAKQPPVVVIPSPDWPFGPVDLDLGVVAVRMYARLKQPA